MADKTDHFTFDDFHPGTMIGVNMMTIDERQLGLWRRVYGEDRDDGLLPAAMSTIVLMHAWRTIVDPKPPGNIHAGQRVEMFARPRLGEIIRTEVRCLSKEERKGRKFVGLETVSTGADGRALFNGLSTLIWAL